MLFRSLDRARWFALEIDRHNGNGVMINRWWCTRDLIDIIQHYCWWRCCCCCCWWLWLMLLLILMLNNSWRCGNVRFSHRTSRLQ